MERRQMSPGFALRLPPGPALDVFVYEYVLGGMIERGPTSGEPVKLPACSRKFSSCHVILIKLIVEASGKDLVTSFGKQNFEAAKKGGFLAKPYVSPTWKVSLGEDIGYGRSFQEAICKLAIVIKRREDAEGIH
jgi:hypothetical protein